MQQTILYQQALLNLEKILYQQIDKLEIDAVLSGHDHSYVRTYQMKNLQPLKKSNDW